VLEIPVSGNRRLVGNCVSVDKTRTVRSGWHYGVVVDVGDQGVQCGFEGVGGVLGLRED
jgi:hypothetical protein